MSGGITGGDSGNTNNTNIRTGKNRISENCNTGVYRYTSVYIYLYFYAFVVFAHCREANVKPRWYISVILSYRYMIS